MIHFMYEPSSEIGSSVCLEDNDISPMILLTRIYAVAEQYQIPDLKEGTKEKFHRDIHECWNKDDFSQIIAEVYTTTYDDVRDLRDEVIKVSWQHIGALLKKDEFQSVLGSYVDFAADLVRVLGEQASLVCDYCRQRRIYDGQECCVRCGNELPTDKTCAQDFW